MKLEDYTIYQDVPNDKVGYSESNECEYVKIDEYFAYIIQQLNIKGYKTRFCCSGHYGFDNQVFEGKEYEYSNNGYIYFKEKYDLGELPNGVINESGHIIRFWFSSKPNTRERINEITYYIGSLSEWVDCLPINKEN